MNPYGREEGERRGVGRLSELFQGRPLEKLRLKTTILWNDFGRVPFSRQLMLIVALQLISLYCYYKGLAGGDVGWVKKNLFRLGIYILVSVLLFCTAIILSIVLIPIPRIRYITIVSIVFTILFAFWSDTGDTFAKHGSYNALVFATLSFIILSISLSLMFCYSLPKRKIIFWRAFVTTTILIVVFLYWRLSHYQVEWRQGMFGRNMQYSEVSGLCSFEYNGNWPWMDLLPDGIQNFWTGSQRCPAQAFNIDATISKTGVLEMKCTKGQGDPFYTILPDTRDFLTPEKVNGQLHFTVRDKTLLKQPYANPVQLKSTQEAVIVQCGENVKELRYNIQISSRFSDEQIQSSSLKRDTIATVGSTPKKPINVLLLFMDAVSRRHVYRKLPKTVQAMRNIHEATLLEKEQAKRSRSHSTNGEGQQSTGSKSSGTGSLLHQFFRYHIVGFNTDDNTRMLYTGNDTKEPSRKTIIEDVFDATSKSRSPYMTLRVETNCEDWSSQYAGRATSKAYDHEMIAPFCDDSYYSHNGHPFGNFKGPYSILRRCLYDRYVHRHTIDYMHKAQRLYREKAPEIPWFMTAAFIEGHEGTGEVLSTIDDELSNFLLALANDGVLRDTAVILMADHGLHMGFNYVYTTNGLIEHANPALFMLLPDRFLASSPEIPEALQHNEQALLTSNHIYHSMRDLMGISNEETPSKSLFRAKLPYSANCAQAGIGAEYCQCK